MIRVGVNARVLGKSEVEGVIRYTRRLLDALAAREADRPPGEEGFRYLLFGVDDVPGFLRGYDSVGCAGEPAPAHSGLRGHLWEQATLPRAVSRADVDVLHTPAGNPPLLSGVPQVTTIHDISPVTHPEWFSRGYAALYRTLTPLTVRRSDRLITVSRFSRDELVREYPHAEGKTVSVHNGQVPPDTPEDDAVPELEGRAFILSVGSDNPRKNLDGLLAAYRRYRERVAAPASLVLVGPTRDIFAGERVEAGDGVEALGFVPEERLDWLYRNADAFVFPSLYEGFGLPIVEAMSAGTPVVTADRGAMAEVAGGAACRVDPTDPEALAGGIERVLDDPEYRRELVADGRSRAATFTWERTARETAAVYRAAAEE